MKKINILFLIGIALTIMSCESNDEVENNNEEKKVLTLSAQLPDADTRTVFTDKANTMKVEWATKDWITVIGEMTDEYWKKKSESPFWRPYHTANQGRFESTNTLNTNLATFEGGLVGLYAITTLYGIYPNIEFVWDIEQLDSNQDKFTVDYSLQKATLEYVQKNAMMTAKTTYNYSGSNMLNFKNETALLRITINMPKADGSPESDKISSIVLAEPQTGTTYSNMINKSDWNISSSKFSDGTQGNVVLNFDTPVTLDATHPVVAYAIVLPQTIANGLVISARGEKNSYSYATIKDLTFEAGKFYRISKDATPLPLYYQWDAYAPYVNGTTTFGEGKEGYNAESTTPSHSCMNCPTKDQILMYLGTNDLYYAKGTGIYAKTFGLWIPKHENIAGWDAGTATKIEMSDNGASKDVYPKMTQPTDLTKYFFLPACGCYESNDLIYKGVAGHYWSSTYYNESRGYYLEFSKSSDTEAYAGLRTAPREYGHFIWKVQ